MTLYIRHEHSSKAAEIYKGDIVYGADASLPPNERARKAVKAAKAATPDKPSLLVEIVVVAVAVVVEVVIVVKADASGLALIILRS